MSTHVAESPLALLRGEIETTLRQVQLALEPYMERPDEAEALDSVIRPMNQVRGALVMLEATESAAVAAETVALAKALREDALAEPDAARDVLLRAVLQMPRFLEALYYGHDKHVNAQPLIRELRTARGLVGKTPDVGAAKPGIAGSDLRALGNQVRPLWQRALVGVLRGQNISDNMDRIAQFCAQFMKAASDELIYHFWWLAEGLAQEVRDGAIKAGQDINFLLRDLDNHIKLLKDADPVSYADPALKDLAQRLSERLAASDSGAARLKQRTGYRPPKALGKSSLQSVAEAVIPPDTETLQQIAVFLKEDLVLIRDAVDRFERDEAREAEALLAEVRTLRPIGNALTLLNMDVPAKLISSRLHALDQQAAAGEPVSENALFEFALELILIEDSLDSIGSFAINQELSNPVAEQLDQAGQVALLMDAQLQRARQLATFEAIGIMGQARELVTAHIESGSSSSIWNELELILHKVGGTLAMLNCDRASRLANRLEDVAKTLADGQLIEERLLSAFAESLVTLEYYLYLLGGGRKPDEDILHHAETQLNVVGEAVGVVTLPVLEEEALELDSASEPELEQRDIDGEAVLDESAPAPVAPSLEELSLALEDAAPEQSAPIEEKAPSPAEEAPEAPAIEVEAEAVAPAEETAEAEPAPVDEEFLEVFYEEALGELASIREQLQAWRQDVDDKQALTSIRRSFHTLKGSGRMVGQTIIGEFAWRYENLLNRVLEGAISPSPELVETVDEAQEALRPLVGDGSAATNEAQARIAELSARAEALLRAEAPAIEVEEEAVAPAEETAEAEPAPAEVDPELIELFAVEASDILDGADDTLQNWKSDPENLDLLNDLRRGMHTVKGSARMAGFMTIGNLAHAIESILDAVAGSTMALSTAAVHHLQHALDGLTSMVAQVRDGRPIPPADNLIDELHHLLTVGESLEAPLAEAPPQPEIVAETEAFAPNQELIDVFLSEAIEILNAADVTLQRWGADQDSQALLNDLRREMHTLKGSSRMAGFMTIGHLAHSIESLLDVVAVGSVKSSAVVVESLQRALDGLNNMLGQAQQGEAIPPADELIHDLNDLAGIAPAPGAALAKPEAVAPGLQAQAQPLEKAVTPASEEAIRVSAKLLNELTNQMGESSIFRARIDQGVAQIRFNLNELEQTVTRLRQQLRRLEIETEAQILFRYEEGPAEQGEDFDPLELDRFSELQQLSRSLVEIVDDLVNIQNLLEDQSQELSFLLDQQGKVNKEIQQGLMRTRMVRFNTMVPRLRRVIRQACQELNKRAELILEGVEAEIDRGVLDRMVAPLEHLLRNSISHGIETPALRRQAGKPEAGAIKLILHREGAELVLTLQDDGAGLNFDAIRTKGETLGMLKPGQPASERELTALLLRPGFSTAQEITQLAGRGVGMDVVNDTIKSMRGTLQIQSKPGEGVTFTIRLPFSLAVTQALLAKAGGEVYAVPLLSIEAVTRLEQAQLKAYLAGEAVVLEYGSNRYPLHSLGILFGGEGPQEDVLEARAPVLLFRSAESIAALQVDAVLGSQEIIVKPVSPQLHSVPGLSGATILGDGRVIIVLELAALVRNLANQAQKQAEAHALKMAQQETEQEGISAMVVDDSITMRKVTARFLERHKLRVTTAKDGVDAIALLEDKVPDLIIMDIEMPRMDGYEVLAHIRNQNHLKHLPVIMVTSRSGEKHRERAVKLGVNDYLIKPYQEEQLMNSIRTVLGERGRELQA